MMNPAQVLLLTCPRPEASLTYQLVPG